MRPEGSREFKVRALTIACIAFVATVVCATPASAQWRVGAFLGGEHESSWDEFLVIGADGRKPIGSNNLEINPRFSYFIRDLMTRFQADFNVIKRLDVASTGRLEPFIGTGVALARTSFDFPGVDNESALGFNYIMGATLKATGSWQAYTQFAYTVLHDSPNAAVVSAGFHYKFK